MKQKQVVKGISFPGIPREKLKMVMHFSVPEFREWLYNYGKSIYEQGANDGYSKAVTETADALKENFGFGPKRIQRLLDAMNLEVVSHE